MDFSDLLFGLTRGFGLFINLLILALYIISLWIIFQKAGKPGWSAIIPIYNIIVYLEKIKKPWWWIFLFLIPVVNLVFYVIVNHQLAIYFGKDAGFTVGLIFLPFIFYPILAFSNAQYNNSDN
ncbi:MAG: DUF5684 domain-containing protein [Rikenellaceae bacterium MAG02]